MVARLSRKLQEQTSAAAKGFVKRCVFNTPFMQCCIAYAASVGFGVEPGGLPEQFLDLVRNIPGWAQSRINEQANKSLRDGERKDNASKAVTLDGLGGVGRGALGAQCMSKLVGLIHSSALNDRVHGASL